MVEKETPIVPPTPTPQTPIPEATPTAEPEVKKPEVIAADELEALNREIEEANKSLVSEDVAKVIKLEKEAAKKEAEKEFLVSQRVKDLEAEKNALIKAKEQSERDSAAKLEALTQKVNGMISSRAPVKNENPFNEKPPADTTLDVSKLTDEQANDIELASMEAFFEAKSKINN
jgi:hypothetical protein